jgi:flagellar protein FlgJ
VTNVGGVKSTAATARATTQEQHLREVAQQLEGVFVQQLFRAMRDTVPTDGVTHGGSGEDIFAGMLDEHVAGAVPRTWHHGIGESLFRQLRASLTSQDQAATAAREKTT